MPLWSVSFLTTSVEADELEKVSTVFGSHQLVFTGQWLLDPVTLGESPGTEGFNFLVEADNAEMARDTGLAHAGRLYAAAHMDSSDLRIVAVRLLHEAQGRADELLELAQSLSAEGHHGLAVVSAQTACEVDLRRAMTSVLTDAFGDDGGQLVRNLVRSFTLMDSGSQHLFRETYGRKPSSYPWWHDYVTHVARRNDVVHNGGYVSAAEAQASISVVQRLLAMTRYDSLGLEAEEHGA